jgi:hypothetical protein
LHGDLMLNTCHAESSTPQLAIWQVGESLTARAAIAKSLAICLSCDT